MCVSLRTFSISMVQNDWGLTLLVGITSLAMFILSFCLSCDNSSKWGIDFFLPMVIGCVLCTTVLLDTLQTRRSKYTLYSMIVFFMITNDCPLHLELFMHDNETLASLRRLVFTKLKANPCSLRLEMAIGQVNTLILTSIRIR